MVRTFKYLSPSPKEIRAFYVLAFGSFLGQFVAFGLALAPDTPPLARAVAVGGALAILARFFVAQLQLDKRRRRAANGRIELQGGGLRFTDDKGAATYVSWPEIDQAQSSNGRLEIKFGARTWGFGAREVENGMTLTQEILRRVAKPQSKSTFIPLEPM